MMAKNVSSTIGNGSNGIGPIVENLYSIIESKIQFIEYRTNEMLNAYLEADEKAHQVSDYESPGIQEMSFTGSVNDFVFSQIETSSRSIHRLLQFKSALSSQNALAILDLLTDDKYLVCSESQLLKMLSYTSSC
jgi:hypothetical protein